MKRYPDPYPIAAAGKIARAKAWVHFRDRPVLSVVDDTGKTGHISVKNGDDLRAQVRSFLDFVFYDPQFQQGQQKNKKNNGQQKPNISPKFPNQPGGNMQNKTNQLPPQRQREYIPQDMKEDIESKETPDGYWQIDPPLDGYYYSTIDSYYDPQTMLWSTRENYSPYAPTLTGKGKKHTFRGKTDAGIISVPLTRGCQIDISTLRGDCRILEDQNGCLVLDVKSFTDVEFVFYTGQTYKDIGPINEDSKNIIGSADLTQKTRDVILALQKSGKPKIDIALAICDYIKTSKKYHIGYQAHIHRTSTTENYFYNLDESEVLECFSANSLYVGIIRSLGIPARMCGGHVPKTKDKKSHISNSTGHAWSEIWDGSKWICTDATPAKQDDHIVEDSERKEKEEAEKMKDQGFDPENDEDKRLYEVYNNIEQSVQPQIRRLIRELEAMLPKEEVPHREDGYKTGELIGSQLVDWKVQGRTNIFERVVYDELDPVMNMAEVIVIDRSGSMYKNGLIDPAIRAAIIRAEVLGYFGVPTNIIFFDDSVTEAMGWDGAVGGQLKGSKNPKKTHGAPARIIKIASEQGGGTNISDPVLRARESLRSFLNTPHGKGRQGSITFIGDGEPYTGLKDQQLQQLVREVAGEFPISAYYLGSHHSAGSLQYYFGTDNTAVVPDVSTLPHAMATQFKKKLMKELQRLGI